MAWQTIDRNEALVDADAPPLLSEAVREKIRSFFDRYETKRAALLPALHIVQNTLGHVSWQAMEEVADLLEIRPSDVMDTISFYTYFWTHPKGKKVVTVCRSVSCEVMGSEAVLAELKKQLGIDEHQTTPCGKYSLMTEECLALCDNAPCLIINEKVHRRVRPEDVARILADDDNDRLTMPRSDLFDSPAESPVRKTAEPATAGDGGTSDTSGKTEEQEAD